MLLQIIIIITLLGLAILVMMSRHWIRYIIIAIFSIIIVFTLLTMIFPLYKEGPNLTKFYKEQSNILYISPSAQKSESKITIQSNGATQTIDTKEPSTFYLAASTTATINFIATEKTDTTLVEILLPEGTCIQIFPQTQITLSSIYPRLVVERKVGLATYIESKNYSPWQLTLHGVAVDQVEKNSIQQQYEKKKSKEMQKQGGGIFLRDPYLKQINKWILVTLKRLFPENFSNNIKNLQAFQAYETIVTQRQVDTTVDPNIQKEVGNQAKKGLEETQIYKRRKNIFK